MTRRDFLGRTLASAALLAIPGFVSWLISQKPPPKTLSKTAENGFSLLRDARWWKSACAGVQCLLCPFEYFLPELGNFAVHAGTRARDDHAA